jgi:Fe-S-cluster containining protein
LKAQSYNHPEGLRWECVRCTKSCGDTPDHKRRILLLEDDVRRIEGETGTQRRQFAVMNDSVPPYEYEMNKEGGKCVFLGNGLCSIYRVRPLICQFSPFWLAQDTDGNLNFRVDLACTGIRRQSPEVPKEHYAELFAASTAAFARNNALNTRGGNQT